MENNFREILILTEQIDGLKALLRDMKNSIHNHCWPAHQEAVQNQGTTEVLDEVRLSGAWMRGETFSPRVLMPLPLPTGYQLTLATSSGNP